MTPKDYVLKYHPEAHIKEDGFLYKVFVSPNGMGFEECIGSDLTEDQAWDEASEWVELYH